MSSISFSRLCRIAIAVSAAALAAGSQGADDKEGGAGTGSLTDLSGVVDDGYYKPGENERKQKEQKRIEEQHEKDLVEYERKLQREHDEMVDAGKQVEKAEADVAAQEKKVESLRKKYHEIDNKVDRCRVSLKGRDGVEAQAKTKWQNAVKKADLATRNGDPNAAKFRAEADKLKTEYLNEQSTTTKLREEWNAAKAECAEAKKVVADETKELFSKRDNLQKARENHTAAKDKFTKTKESDPPSKQKPGDQRTIGQKILETGANVVQTTEIGGTVYDFKEGVDQGNQEQQRQSANKLVETAATTEIAALGPGGAAVAVTYTTAKTVIDATDEAGKMRRADIEARDAGKDAKAQEIARDIMQSSIDPNTGKPTIDGPTAQLMAEGYVYGHGDQDTADAIEALYDWNNPNALRDDKGHVKPMPKILPNAKEYDTPLDATKAALKDGYDATVDFIGTGIKETAKSVLDNSAKTVLVIKETAEDLEGITDKNVLSETKDLVWKDIKEGGKTIYEGGKTAEFWNDRAEAAVAVGQGIYDSTKETIDNLLGRQTVDDQIKEKQRELAYKLLDSGMSPAEAAQTAQDYFSEDVWSENGRKNHEEAIQKVHDAIKTIHEEDAIQSTLGKDGGYSLRDGEDLADPAGETGKGFPQKTEGNNFFTDVQKDRDEATIAANNLGTIITGEREQESKNEIAQQTADQTLNAGGENANQTLNETAANIANEQDKNSWTTAISDGLQQSLNTGLSSLGTSFGNELGKHVANEIFDDPDKPKGGAQGGAKGGTVAKGGGKGKGKGKGKGEGEGKGEGDPEVAGDPGHGKGKDPGKSGDGGKQPNADTAGNCKRCGVSFSKVPEASDADDKFTTSTVGISCKGYCVICLNDEIGSSKWTKVYSEEELKGREDPMQCTRCKRYISLSTTADERSDDPVHGAGTQWSGKMLCHSCVADLWREKTGVAKTTAGDSSSDGKINGTYSSSSGPANKTDMGAYTCAWCGKKTNSIVSGVGSGVYCSNACYQKFLDSRKQSQGLSVRSKDAYKEDPSVKMRELPKDRQFRDALLPAPDSKDKL